MTVDRKSGAIKGHPETEVTDLPGIYSMSPYSSEEIVTRQFIIGEKPTGIINIVDATNIERNLYLSQHFIIRYKLHIYKSLISNINFLFFITYITNLQGATFPRKSK